MCRRLVPKNYFISILVYGYVRETLINATLPGFSIPEMTLLQFLSS